MELAWLIVYILLRGNRCHARFIPQNNPIQKHGLISIVNIHFSPFRATLTCEEIPSFGKPNHPERGTATPKT
jgi:hypothetical protein